MIEKSSLSIYIINYEFTWTVRDILTKFAWAKPLKNKSNISLTNGFKIIFSEGRRPEKKSLEIGSEFSYETFKLFFKEHQTEQ